MADSDNWIKQRAYELWEADGQPHGKHDEHWAQATAEYEARHKANAKPTGKRKAEVKSPAEPAKNAKSKPAKNGSVKDDAAKAAPEKVQAEKAEIQPATAKKDLAKQSTAKATSSKSSASKAAAPKAAAAKAAPDTAQSKRNRKSQPA